MRKEVQISYTSDDGDETISMYVPAKNQICDECEGEGKVDHPAFSNGITESEREDMGEESFERYMNGDYDVACPCCKGGKIIKVPDVYSMTMNQKRHAVLVRRHQREERKFEREYAAIQNAERAFGC